MLPLLACLFLLMRVQSDPPGKASAHVHGPHGLQGWTLSYPLPAENGGAEVPGTLVIARGDGHVVRRIEGDPFVWSWIFVSDGREVAYETGPLHFGLQCVLVSLRTGRNLATYDCYRALPASAPAWVKALERATNTPQPSR